MRVKAKGMVHDVMASTKETNDSKESNDYST
jgi:hypothetical protein